MRTAIAAAAGAGAGFGAGFSCFRFALPFLIKLKQYFTHTHAHTLTHTAIRRSESQPEALRQKLFLKHLCQIYVNIFYNRRPPLPPLSPSSCVCVVFGALKSA